MIEFGRKVFPTRVGANKECPTAASWVHYSAITVPNTKRIDHVDNFRAGIILPVFMPFFWADQRFKNLADDVVFELSEIEDVDVSASRRQLSTTELS